MPLSPTLAEQAYDTIEALIVTLELAPGEVFTEGELGERVGIGRTPLREALQRLIAQRLVVSIPRRGMRVTAIDLADMQALLETRRVLERLVAQTAARRATPNQRDELAACADAAEDAARSDDLAAFLRADREGDELLEAASRNPYATRALSALHVHCRRLWVRFRHDGDLVESATLHAAVLRAVADGDDAAAATATDRLLDYLDAFARDTLTLN
ncbi:MAG: GntR family transcriptional regulator [Bacteroidota bacterium]